MRRDGPPELVIRCKDAVTPPAAVYAADAPHADATAKDACIKACNECLRCRAMRR
jgi:hypothetical protein